MLSAAASFPDAAYVEALRSLGIRSVVIDREFAAGSALADAVNRSTVGLPLDRRDLGGVVVYRFR